MVPSSAVLETRTATETSPAPQTVARATGRLSKVALLAVGVQLVVIYWPTVSWLLDRWTMSVWHNAHGLLIPPVVGYFVYQELRQVRHLPSEASAWGFAFLVPALLLHALDMGMHTQLLSAFSLVLILPGLFLLFLGARRTRAVAFPLAFSIFMLPIPLALTERLHLVLRQVATFAVTQIAPLLGIAMYSEGTTIQLADQTLLVGDGCSGFSTLYAACAVAALTAYACPQPRRRIAVLLLAAPIAIAANVLRVLLLVMLVDWRGEDVLSTWIHPASGMFTFALALPLIFWLGTPKEQREKPS